VPVVAVDQFAARLRHAPPARARPPHRRHIAGPRDWLEARSAIEGWRAALAAAGAEAPPCCRRLEPALGLRARAAAAREGRRRAVFVANDQMALGLLRALHEAGRESRATSASSASTTSPRRSTSRRR
jgi:DNA-binding LacI/PurR family transcriptional regulator